MSEICGRLQQVAEIAQSQGKKGEDLHGRSFGQATGQNNVISMMQRSEGERKDK